MFATSTNLFLFHWEGETPIKVAKKERNEAILSLIKTAEVRRRKQNTILVDQYVHIHTYTYTYTYVAILVTYWVLYSIIFIFGVEAGRSITRAIRCCKSWTSCRGHKSSGRRSQCQFFLCGDHCMTLYFPFSMLNDIIPLASPGIIGRGNGSNIGSLYQF